MRNQVKSQTLRYPKLQIAQPFFPFVFHHRCLSSAENEMSTTVSCSSCLVALICTLIASFEHESKLFSLTKECDPAKKELVVRCSVWHKVFYSRRLAVVLHNIPIVIFLLMPLLLHLPTRGGENTTPDPAADAFCASTVRYIQVQKNKGGAVAEKYEHIKV